MASTYAFLRLSNMPRTTASNRCLKVLANFLNGSRRLPVENLNSRLRNYFFLLRQLDTPYLSLLQFFLNHRTFQRSRRPNESAKVRKN